jgi:transmembrane sensor
MLTERTQEEQFPNSAQAEAAAWVARLHGSRRSRALEEGFRLWLTADPSHAAAFELATEAWELGGNLSGAGREHRTESASHRPYSLTRRALAASVVCAAVLGSALYYYGNRELNLATRVGEQRTITLNDGTRVHLNTDTRISVKETDTRRHVRLKEGEVLFEVSPDPARPFVVTVDEKEVVALGTSFVVRHEPQRTAVTLMEGRVAVAPASNSRRLRSDDLKRSDTAGGLDDWTFLAPGQRLTFEGSAAPVIDEPPLDSVAAWRRGEVVLDKTTLQDAAVEMNRYSALKLVIDDPDIAGIQVSGVFRTGDSARFARAVGEAYQLSVHRTPEEIVIGSRD